MTLKQDSIFKRISKNLLCYFPSAFEKDVDRKAKALEKTLLNGKFKIFSNFNSEHGKKYITSMFKVEKIKANNNGRQLYISSQELREDIFDETNISLLKDLKKDGNIDLKILISKEIKNSFLDKSLRSTIKVNKKEDYPSYILTEESFAIELGDDPVYNTPEEDHKALFFIGIEFIAKHLSKLNKDDRKLISKALDDKHKYHKELEELWGKS